VEDMEMEGSSGRNRRNIFGTILSTLTGLVSEEDFNKLKETEKELERKVRTIIKHETDMATTLDTFGKEITAIYYDEQKAHRKLEWNADMTFSYWSRKNYRDMLLKEYMDRQTAALATAFAGYATASESAGVIASIGIRGFSTVYQHSLTANEDTLQSNTFFDIGTMTPVYRTARNDSTTQLQTTTKTYLVSEHYLEGSALTMAETRIIAPITNGCALMVHITQGHYKITQSGNLTCKNLGKEKAITHSCKKGGSIYLARTDKCKNTCIQIGQTGYQRTYRSLHTQPSMHPPTLKVFSYTEENRNAPIRTTEGAHQVAHDLLTGDIRENKDLLEQMADNDAKYDRGHTFGLVGMITSTLVVMFLLYGVFMCTRGRAISGICERKHSGEPI
jgi:hypothetical protein